MYFVHCRLLSALIASVAMTLSAHADTYPSKPVRIVVPFPPGGSTDTLARQIAAGLQQMWGQGVVVDNRPGASGNIGSTEVVRAAADGYTLLAQNPTMIGNLAVMGKLPYDPMKDLAPILYLGDTPMVLVAHPSSNISNVKELVAAAKAKPGGLNYGSCGIGTPMHFAMELLKDQTGVDATHVSYKGCAPALVDVLGGQVPLAIVTANLVVPHIRSGKLKAVGIASAQRYAQLPDLQTFEEQGAKGVEMSNWNALMGPAKLPPEIVAKLAADITKVLADAALMASVAKTGVVLRPAPANVLANVLRSDSAKYTKLAKDHQIKAE
ncbi:MAG: tripartite tricarboxylate transporter substrate binding protein [Polaromonas sp.]|uniref:Bug family tripartite tricarboxylate transporter substrate binding protein n=1 Tax=Polaromonas sp. TaxID=1869339 RepID=UPI0025D141FA|nr:tripartite tricarboxylate transporter substrate binding protein [Polaromonas sp.]MBI2726503.1 tripartite tricarboxylate transporter substrate binding protein [Polaromonas sp.]